MASHRYATEPSSSRQRVNELLPRVLATLRITAIHAIQLNVAVWDAFALDEYRAAANQTEPLRSGVWLSRVRRTSDFV